MWNGSSQAFATSLWANPGTVVRMGVHRLLRTTEKLATNVIIAIVAIVWGIQICDPLCENIIKKFFSLTYGSLKHHFTCNSFLTKNDILANLKWE